MPEIDQLLTLAEISVALAGFSSIVVLFRRGPAGKWEPFSAMGFRDMIRISLGSAGFCLLPLAMAQLPLGADLVWRIPSVPSGSMCSRSSGCRSARG